MKRELRREAHRAMVQWIQELRRSNAARPLKNKKKYHRKDKYGIKYDD